MLSPDKQAIIPRNCLSPDSHDLYRQQADNRINTLSFAYYRFSIGLLPKGGVAEGLLLTPSSPSVSIDHQDPASVRGRSVGRAVGPTSNRNHEDDHPVLGIVGGKNGRRVQIRTPVTVFGRGLGDKKHYVGMPILAGVAQILLS